MRLLARCASAALLLLSPLVAASAADARPAPGSRSPDGGHAPLYHSAGAIADQYIVTLAPGVDARTFADRLGVEPQFVYRGVLNGFAAELSPERLKAVRGLTGVSAVEENGSVSVPHSASPAQAAAAPAASWGLDRIDQRQLPLDGGFTVRGTGRGSSIYILDTGIDYGHEEFGGRAVFGFDAVGDGRRGQDCNGHGTHVAGTAGGAEHGVAREATLVSVRVLDCRGEGSTAGLLAGLDWIHRNARQPAVLNASLGGPRSYVENAAFTAVSDRGVLPVVAAGNENQDACNVSPASARRVVTVGATDRADHQAGFSNYGECLFLYAPGRQIVSARLGGGSVALDGTSMAAPHAAGVAALYKADRPWAGYEIVGTFLADQATGGVVRDAGPGSPNLLLFTDGL